MPYNTTPIPPRREPVGQAQLPLSRVKKIIALDSDVSMCSNNAAFVITLATEMFIQYLAEQGYNVVKSEKNHAGIFSTATLPTRLRGWTTWSFYQT